MSHLIRARSGLPHLLWESFRSTSGPVLTTLSLVATLVAWIFSHDVKVSIVWLVFLTGVAVVVVSTLAQAAFAAYKSTRRLPAIRLASKPPPAYRDVHVVILLEASELFAHDSLVSVYQLQEHGYEVLVAIGRVLTVQDNGLIQVGVHRMFDPNTHLLEKLVQNDKRVLESLLVKPSVPRSVSAADFLTGGESRER